MATKLRGVKCPNCKGTGKNRSFAGLTCGICKGAKRLTGQLLLTVVEKARKDVAEREEWLAWARPELALLETALAEEQS